MSRLLGTVVTVVVFFSGFLVGPVAAAQTCDASGISADLGQPLQVVRCSPGWAYVTNGALGDSTSLVRLSDGVWSRYTGFPSSICRAGAVADGVPATELSRFRPC